MTSLHVQRGATLIIALILLATLTLFTLRAWKRTTTDLKVAGNMQVRSEALSATQEAVEKVISSEQFMSNPTNAVLQPCGSANTLCYDYTGDGRTDYITRLIPAPTCISRRPIKLVELNV